MPPERENRSVLLGKPGRPLIAPSVLSGDFGAMAVDAGQVLEAGADLLHVDVMDGHFAPNLTMGPDMCRGLREHLPGATLDVHLMVTEPQKFVEPFARSGADNITFHAEVLGTTAPSGAEMVEMIRAAGCTAGVAINPDTPASAIDGLIESVDLVLVMSVVPGFSGQKFIASVLDKVRLISSRLGPSQWLEMDGGIGPDTAGACIDAGCRVLVAGSAVMGLEPAKRGEAISSIRNADQKC